MDIFWNNTFNGCTLEFVNFCKHDYHVIELCQNVYLNNLNIGIHWEQRIVCVNGEKELIK